VAAILITGAGGFVGRNLIVRLEELGGHEILPVLRETTPDALAAAMARAEIVLHLAGTNRTPDPAQFQAGNAGFTAALCAAAKATGRAIPIAYASSIRAADESDYGRSKRAAEIAVEAYGAETGAPAFVYRLPNIFGKWARPDYNSAVATFCHNVARGLPITIHDPAAPLNLVYIDDVVEAFVRLVSDPLPASGRIEVEPAYCTTVGAVADEISEFPHTRQSLLAPRTGTGLTRALFSTYLSYLEPDDFAYTVPVHADPRGAFVEMLKTPDCGQFSYFTSKPGITRGDHYHHTKVEKFLVLSGKAHFGFRHIQSGERHELVTEGGEARIVETIPGWTHNITNVGDTELVVMLWANEIFDRARPDTMAMAV
jgi:UDP-2-acetamido-2,6-beta-L-arabino-hexul-4-ose reductase